MPCNPTSKFWGTPAHKIAMSYYLNGDIANNGWSPNKREVLWGEAGQVYETQISRALKCSAKCKLNLSSHLKNLHSHCRSRIWRTEGCSEWSCTGTRRSRKSAAGKRFSFRDLKDKIRASLHQGQLSELSYRLGAVLQLIRVVQTVVITVTHPGLKKGSY